MSSESKIAVYETHIEDMLKTLQESLEELDGKDLDDFELGRRLAFTEMFEIIKTRHQIILDVLKEN